MSGATWPATYEIRVANGMDHRWSDWLEWVRVENRDGETVLTGTLPDQSALHGVLGKLSDLGLTITAVRRLPERPSKRPAGRPAEPPSGLDQPS